MEMEIGLVISPATILGLFYGYSPEFISSGGTYRNKEKELNKAIQIVIGPHIAVFLG